MHYRRGAGGRTVAGYADQNDADTLRADPLLKLACRRLPESRAALASQPTFSRRENAVNRLVEPLPAGLAGVSAQAHQEICQPIGIEAEPIGDAPDIGAEGRGVPGWAATEEQGREIGKVAPEMAGQCLVIETCGPGVGQQGGCEKEITVGGELGGAA